jgi:FeS assembly SUF system protein
MGLFSFLGGSKDAPTIESTSGHEGAAAVASATPAAVSERDDTWSAIALEPEPASAPAAEKSGWDIDTGALTAPPPAKPDAPVVGPPDPELTAAMQGPIIEVIKTVYDPEIPVDVYELGLIYDILVDAERRVLVKMTLTSPACPSAQQLPSEVRYKIKALPEVTEAVVEIVWEPPWDKDRMSEAAKLQLGFF